MSNPFFRFKQFTIHHERCAMKVTTDACLFGAWAAEKICSSSNGKQNGIDIGAGTGLLSLMLLQKNPQLTITAVEIDGQAAVQAAENAAASPWHSSIQLITGDVKAQQNVLTHKYDVVISNPPFYENELQSPDEKKNTAHHDRGLLLEELLRITSGILKPEGSFYLLLPFKRMDALKQLVDQYNLLLVHITKLRHSTKHPYTRIFVKGRHIAGIQGPLTEDEISISAEGNKYTPEFISLLRDYYLNF